MSQSASSLVRFEVEVPEADVGLIKRAVAALVDPERRLRTRRQLRRTFSDEAASLAPPDLKALLSSPLLQDVDLERPRDHGRDVDL